MKKMIVAACIVAMAAVSNGATIKWQFTGPSNDQSLKNAQIFCLVGSEAPTSIDNWDTWIGKQTSVSTKTITWDNMKKNTKASDTPDSSTITADKSYYFVMLSPDGKQFATTGIYAGSDIVYDTSKQQAAITTNISSSFGAFQNIGNVPEPTSAMLMLIGMAGLALRRRRA